MAYRYGRVGREEQHAGANGQREKRVRMADRVGRVGREGRAKGSEWQTGRGVDGRIKLQCEPVDAAKRSGG